MRFSSFAVAVSSLVGLASSLPGSTEILDTRAQTIKPSFSTAKCPGYTIAGKVKEYDHGFTVPLALAGKACNAYGVDIQHLTLSVVYEKKHQLHVHIYDTAQNQFQQPLNLIFNRSSSDPSKVKDGVSASQSDLEFHHTAEQGYDNKSSPSWAFWITRKGNNKAGPIFDTRAEKIPTYDTPFNASAVNTERNTTAMPNHNLIFENQYLQLSSALPTGANLYGLGERYSLGGIGGSSWRLDPDGTLQPFFALDVGDPLASNMYGYHPIYLEGREVDGKLQSHVVAYQNTAGLDVIMRRGVVQYRAIGGTLDFRFFSGDCDQKMGSQNEKRGEEIAQEEKRWYNEVENSPTSAIEQYVEYVSLPIMIPRWSLGFHMLRWGYSNTSQVRSVVDRMRDENIPLEVIWSDIDYLHSFRDFTIDPNSYGDYPQFVNDLTSRGQRWIPIIDTAIPATPLNSSDVYNPGTRGDELDIFVKNENGTKYIGIVWPGPANFLDTHADNAQKWWSEALTNLSTMANYSGIWLDMSEPSSFIVGSAVDPNDLASSNSQYIGATSVGGWPEGYCNTTSGNTGNITVNGAYTYTSNCLSGTGKPDDQQQQKRQLLEEVITRMHARDIQLKTRQEDTGDSGNSSDSHYSPGIYNYNSVTERVLHDPPYAIHNGIFSSEGPLVDNLDKKTVAMPSITKLGVYYDVKNIQGTMLAMRTHNALKEIHPDERPFVVARSSSPGMGGYASHWLGDNFSLWQYMAKSIEGLLQFQLFGIPTVGPDLCGFNGNSDEELCNRWMMLGAFNPFMRQHNTQGAISQEPYVWDSVATASRTAIGKRYELLPEMYSIRARSSQKGTPMVKSLWYEFPSQFNTLKGTDTQFMLGPNLLVSPVIEPNVTTVNAFIPEAGGTWRNIFTYEALNVKTNSNVSIPAPLSSINVHMRPGRAILTHAQAKYTTTETTNQPFSLWVNLNDQGKANGDAYIDDGKSNWPTANRELYFTACNNKLEGSSNGKYHINQKLQSVVLMGINKKPSKVTNGKGKNLVNSAKYDSSKKLLNVTNVDEDLNGKWSVSWS